jgi:S-adenosylmethionine decarboxylase
MKTTSYSGLHLLANMHNINIEVPALSNMDFCKSVCISTVTEAGLTIVGDFFHSFGDGGGFTGVVVLAESHMAIHTWPESGYVTLDVFVCNHNRDNSVNAKQLFETLISVFNPKEVKRIEVVRE